nr:hypothetical protein [Tanacetum cinerariifolium]
MAGRSTRSNTANDTNPPNETADEVARQLNIALPNLLTQLVQALGGNRVNQREATPNYSIKTFRASGAKEFFRTEGAVGLLTWFESIEAVLHITKCPAESQVEFASSMLQGHALTWWNTLVQTRGRAAAIAQSWEGFKKLLMEEYCPDDEVEKLESEFWNHKMVGSDINGYTAIFHELARLVPHMVTPESQRENVGNKKRSNDQNRNRGRGDRNKRQRTGSNFAMTTQDQGQGQRQYAGQHPRCAKCNFHHSGNCPVCGRCKQVGHFTRYYTSRVVNERPRPTCYECGDPNHFRRNCLRINQATTAGGNRPNLVLAIEGNPKPGNNRNRAQGRDFTLGVAEAPQDPNVVTASGVKVATNMTVRGCRLELEGHTFIIDLIPFGHGSFNVIIGMDWLSKLRAKIVCFKKIVLIPLPNGDILEVHGEHLSGLPPTREIEFRIDLIHEAMPVAKSPYRLAPTE